MVALEIVLNDKYGTCVFCLSIKNNDHRIIREHMAVSQQHSKYQTLLGFIPMEHCEMEIDHQSNASEPPY